MLMQEIIAVEYDELPNEIDSALMRCIVDTHIRGLPYDPSMVPAALLPDPILDVRGRRCPYPVNHMNRRLERLSLGQQFVLITDDPIAKIDVRHALRVKGNLLRLTIPTDESVAFLIEKDFPNEITSEW